MVERGNKMISDSNCLRGRGRVSLSFHFEHSCREFKTIPAYYMYTMYKEEMFALENNMQERKKMIVVVCFDIRTKGLSVIWFWGST